MEKSYKQLTDDDCKKLLKKYNTPLNIFLHQRKVNAVAKFFAHKLKEAGKEVDIDLIDKASLLHDIKKFDEIKNIGGRHVVEGENTLIAEGYPEVAQVVGRHGLNAISREGTLQNWNDIIVYFTDKIVNHDKVVSLSKRIEYMKERYGAIHPQAMDNILTCEPKLHEMEKNIYTAANLSIGDVTEESVKPYLIDETY